LAYAVVGCSGSESDAPNGNGGIAGSGAGARGGTIGVVEINGTLVIYPRGYRGESARYVRVGRFAVDGRA
jgi:hypothetical protein